MNAIRLLAHHEQVADAPDAIARLRRFVLDLAVRGKLVPQDLNDERVSELLKRIAKEKVRLIKAGKIKNKLSLPAVSSADTPFLIPPTWEWVRFANISEFSAGRTPSRNDPSFWNNDDYAWVSIADMKDGKTLTVSKETISAKARKQVFRAEPEPPGTILMSFKLTIGKVARLGIPAFHNEAIISIRPHMLELDPYLFKVLPQFAQQGDTKGAIKGATLNRDSISNILLPLPPLAEQHRIVAKVDELMSLCDRLEAMRTGREAVRDQLTAASLALLNAPDPEKFEAAARFALDALPALTTRPDQIKRLRQTILNLAVRGKLVPQNLKEESAPELLKRIANEKARLVKEGKAKRQDALPEIDVNQAPFDLPDGWAWGRFPEVGIFGRGKSKHRPRNDPALFDGGEHLMIQTGDVARSQGVIENYTSKYNDLGLSQSFKWPKGTLCITIAANIADSGILSFDACFPDSVVGFIPASIFKNARYFEYFVRTAKSNLLTFAPATAQKNINIEILTQVLIPLPPLAEQDRIVAKVDTMMELCDRLEASLTDAATTRHLLLDALLAEALTPAEHRSGATVVERIADVAIVKPGKIVETERSALILMLAYERHRSALRDKTFGHVKAQKILHLVEAEADFDLGRAPIRDAAGPNDFQHMLNVEKWAQQHRRFAFEKNGSGYVFKPLSDYRNLLDAVGAIDAATRARIEKVIDIFIPMDMEASEVFATVYAAWNNLLIEKKNSEDSDIVRAAREEWHHRKLKIPYEKFVAALQQLRRSNLVPSGRGKFVPSAQQQDMFTPQ